MRLRNVKNANEIVNNCKFLIKNPERYKGKYNTLFNNNNPIYLEVGMGKGSFLIQNAINNPNINYIGVEKMTSILARAIQKISPYNLNNLKVIRADALELANIFDQEIDTLFLNFSDPWPKNRHANRRLTSKIFLQIYDKIFKKEKTIIQKTDNIHLFESSIISLNDYGYKIVDISLDLHNSDKENYMSEYEEKFSKMNIRINYLKAIKK